MNDVIDITKKEFGQMHQFRIYWGEDEDNLFRIGSGITGVEPSGEEEVESIKYLDGEGFSTMIISGKTDGLTFSGHRDYKDDAQNLILDKQNDETLNRGGFFRIKYPHGKIKEGPAIVHGITEMSGEAGDREGIEFTITFSGKPKVSMEEV